MREFRENDNIRMPEKERFNELRDKLGMLFKMDGKGASLTVSEADRRLEKRLNTELAREKPPMENQLTREWPKLRESRGLEAELKECNPNFELGREWKINCQRCVPTAEMRRRGYDVTAKPRPVDDRSGLAFSPFSVWKSPEVIRCRDDGLEDIRRNMQKWGDGARAQVVVVWKNSNSGHTFCAEQVNGKTIFYDPQTGKADVSNYFKRVQPGSVQLCRIDNQDLTDKILDCCRKA